MSVGVGEGPPKRAIMPPKALLEVMTRPPGSIIAPVVSSSDSPSALLSWNLMVTRAGDLSATSLAIVVGSAGAEGAGELPAMVAAARQPAAATRARTVRGSLDT